MAIEFGCHQCKTPLSAPDGTEGRGTGCPICGAAVTVPGGAVAAVPGAAFAVRTDERLRDRGRAGEPWYYRFLAVYGWACAALGLIQFLLAVPAVVSRATDANPPAWGTLGFSLGVLLGCLLVAAAAFVLVDVGRQVRARR